MTAVVSTATADFFRGRLGRVPSAPDERNWKASSFLGDTAPDQLDVALAALMSSHASKATKAFADVLVPRIHALEGSPAPSPTPAPPTSAVDWPDEHQLDQLSTPHCVGFGGAQYCNTLGSERFDDHFTDNDGHTIYDECKVIDGEPGKQNGSSVHSLAKALINRGRIDAYAFADNIEVIKQWVLTKGPVVLGTDWYTGMFEPAATGLVVPTGKVEGGHCYVVVGYDPTTGVFMLQNSWGKGWGVNGYFYMHESDLAKVYATNGEGLVAVELAA